MRLQDFLGSKPITQLGFFIAQRLPRFVGYGIAGAVAKTIARRKPAVYWAIRANLQQVCPSSNQTELHQMAHAVFLHAGMTYCDFFRAARLPAEQLVATVTIPDRSLGRVEAAVAQERGVLLLGVHTSCFNLPILTLGARGLPVLVLSHAAPGTANHLLDRLRSIGRLESVPITPEYLRSAVRWLRDGNVVVTGADLPVSGDRELIEFFGRPAYLPVGPARLAALTGAIVLLGSCFYEPQRGYVLDITGPIPMERTGSRIQDAVANTHCLARVMERYVRQRPEQWLMFHRVWPQAAEGS